MVKDYGLLQNPPLPNPWARGPDHAVVYTGMEACTNYGRQMRMYVRLPLRNCEGAEVCHCRKVGGHTTSRGPAGALAFVLKATEFSR